MPVSDKFADVRLLGGLEYVNNIISALALLISFKLEGATKWYQNKVFAKFDCKLFAYF